MGCSQSTPAGDTVGFHRRQVEHQRSAFTETVSHPPTGNNDGEKTVSVSHSPVVSDGGRNPVSTIHQPELYEKTSANRDVRSCKTDSSSPSSSSSPGRFAAAKKKEHKPETSLEKPDAATFSTSEAQENNRVSSALRIQDHPKTGTHTGVEGSRVRSKKEDPQKSMKVNCRKTGNSGGLRPTKPVLAPHVGGFSAIGSLLIIDAPLSPRRSVALAAVAAACRAEGFTGARMPSVTERKSGTDKDDSVSKHGKETQRKETQGKVTQDKGLQRKGFKDEGKTIPHQKEAFNEMYESIQTTCNFQSKNSFPPASPLTSVRPDAAKGKSTLGESASSAKPYSSILQRLKSTKAKLIYQVYVPDRFHQLLHLKSKGSYDQLDLTAERRSVTTAAAADVREYEHKSNSKQQHHTGTRKVKQLFGVFSLAALLSSEKKKGASKKSLFHDQRKDARRKTGYASVENTKVALTRRAKALRCSVLLINASVRCAFWSLFTCLDRAHQRDSNQLNQIPYAGDDPCQPDLSLAGGGRRGLKEDVDAVKQTVESQECAAEHVQVERSQTTSVRVLGSEVALQQAAALAAREISTTALTGTPFGEGSNMTETKLSLGGSLGFEKENRISSVEEQLLAASPEELRAVWCVMKIGAAGTRQQKAEWLQRLELLIVKLDPMDTREPTRDALLEARLLDRCVEFLKDFPNCADLCASSLAIMVYMSLNEETSKQLAANHGYEAVAAVLKKYYTHCVDLATKRGEKHIYDTDPQQRAERHYGAGASSANRSGSHITAEASTERVESSLHSECPGEIAAGTRPTPRRGTADSNTPPDRTTDRREDSSAQGAQWTLQADMGTLSGAYQFDVNTTTSKRPGPAEEPQQMHMSDATVEAYGSDRSVEGSAVNTGTETLLVELLTLIWRIIFASSLDGDEYAQIWVAAGAAEPAIESLASDLPVFFSSSFICWVFGALRFLPLDNPALCIDFVQHRQLFQSVIRKMEMHCTEPMLMENGFAVLANYQRNHPAHTTVLCNIPEVWQKCVNWLQSPELFYAPDTVYQGLYAIGLACSYSLDACIGLKQAGGVELATRLAATYEIFPVPELGLESTLDSELTIPESSGSLSEEYSINNDKIKKGAADDTAETVGDYHCTVGGSADSATAAEPVMSHSSAPVEPAPAADNYPSNMPDHVTSECVMSCTAEKMKVVFHFAEGLIRLLESCVATGELAARSLLEEAITEEDEEETDEEEEHEEVHECFKQEEKTNEKAEELLRPADSTENGKEDFKQKAGQMKIANTFRDNRIEASMNGAYGAAPHFEIRAESASNTLQREDYGTSFRQMQELAASSGRSEGSESVSPRAELCGPEQAELNVRPEQEESEDEHERRNGKNAEEGSSKQESKQADKSEAEYCSGHARFKKENSGEKTSDSEDERESGQKVKYRLLVSSGEVPTLQAQQANIEEVGEEQGNGAQMQNTETTFRATDKKQLKLNKESEGQTREENANIESGGSAVGQSSANYRTDELSKSVRPTEEQQAMAKLPESGCGSECYQVPSKALPVTERAVGAETEAVQSGEDAEENEKKKQDKHGEMKTDNEDDIHFHVEETLLLLPSCGGGQYTKCPTCEIDEEEQEEESDDDIQGERQHYTGKHPRRRRHAHADSAEILHLSRCPRSTRNSSRARNGKKQFRCLSSHFSPSSSGCCCSLADDSAFIHQASSAPEEGKVSSTERCPPDRPSD